MDGLRGFAWILLMQTAGELLSQGLAFPFPGPVVGILLLVVSLSWPPIRQPVSACSNLLLSHLSLLFVPVGVGVMTHLSLLSNYGVQIFAVIVVSTWIGLVVTVCLLHWSRRHQDV